MLCRLVLSLGLLLTAAPLAAAQDAAQSPAPAAETAAAEPAAPAPDGATIAVELNKLEPVDGACRAYFIIRNGTDGPVDALELDTFLFDPDEIILQRLALPFGPVAAGRMQIFPFDLALDCGSIGKLFVNEVLRCDAGGADCSGALAMSSRADAALEY